MARGLVRAHRLHPFMPKPISFRPNPALEFIFFDVGSTLLFANRDRMLAPLHARGIRPSEEQLLAVERTAKNEFDDILEHGGRVDLGFWNLFYDRLFEQLEIDDEALRQNLIANTRLSANWDQMRQGTRDALAQPSLISAVVQRLGKRASLHFFADADHSFHLPARSGRKDADLRKEMLDVLARWTLAVTASAARSAD